MKKVLDLNKNLRISKYRKMRKYLKDLLDMIKKIIQNPEDRSKLDLIITTYFVKRIVYMENGDNRLFAMNIEHLIDKIYFPDEDGNITIFDEVINKYLYTCLIIFILYDLRCIRCGKKSISVFLVKYFRLTTNSVVIDEFDSIFCLCDNSKQIGMFNLSNNDTNSQFIYKLLNYKFHLPVNNDFCILCGNEIEVKKELNNNGVILDRVYHCSMCGLDYIIPTNKDDVILHSRDIVNVYIEEILNKYKNPVNGDVIKIKS
jgi:DNA-directed RNA polymerase subunit RPC12/RpoP